MKDFLNSSGFSKEFLSQKTGIELDRINLILSGSEEPTLNDVIKIAKVLKVPPDFLISKPEKYEEINVLFRQSLNKTADDHKADKISYIISNAFSLLNQSDFVKPIYFNFPAVEN